MRFQKERFTGFFGKGQDPKNESEPVQGLFFPSPMVHTLLIPLITRHTPTSPAGDDFLSVKIRTTITRFHQENETEW